MISETVTIPKKALEEVFTAGRRLLAAEDALENAVLISSPEFIKKMRRLRREHLRGKTEPWHSLKAKYGL